MISTINPTSPIPINSTASATESYSSQYRLPEGMMSLGQKNESVERWGIVMVRRSLGKPADELHSQKEAHLKVGALEPQPSGYEVIE